MSNILLSVSASNFVLPVAKPRSPLKHNKIRLQKFKIETLIIFIPSVMSQRAMHSASSPCPVVPLLRTSQTKRFSSAHALEPRKVEFSSLSLRSCVWTHAPIDASGCPVRQDTSPGSTTESREHQTRPLRPQPESRADVQNSPPPMTPLYPARCA